MTTWKSRGLRGSVLEDLINRTNTRYREQHLALVQKIPTPITPVRMDPGTRHITLAYFEQRSTVDYIGVVQGIPLCFDAKECQKDTFPIQNIHEHQMLFMQDFEDQGGIAFFMIFFSEAGLYYYVPYRQMVFFWNRAKTAGLKHFKREELDEKYIVLSNGYYLHYLEAVQKDLSEREEV